MPRPRDAAASGKPRPADSPIVVNEDHDDTIPAFATRHTRCNGRRRGAIDDKRRRRIRMYVTTKKRRVRRSPATWLAAATVLLGACDDVDFGARDLITEFTASHQRACVGDRVTLEWQTRDVVRSAELLVNGRRVSTALEGSYTDTIDESGTVEYSLTAEARDRSWAEERTVSAVATGWEEIMAGQARCVTLDDGLNYWRATMEAVPFSASARVDVIRNPLARTIAVRHNGVVALIDPMSETSAFSGHSISGSWEVTGEMFTTDECWFDTLLTITADIECR
jgi:hypothetical protein